MSQSDARYALYYAPALCEPLSQFGRSWLGIDPQTSQPVAQETFGLDAEFVRRITADARRYGLHGTLKAPFRLASGHTLATLKTELEAFCRAETALALPPFRLTRIGGFLALTPSSPAPALHALAAKLVTQFDSFRAPLETADKARRLAAGLSANQQRLLEAWGYPYVLEEFQFHVTLSCSLTTQDQHDVETALKPVLAAIEAMPAMLRSVCLFADPGQGQPFRLLERYPLTG